MTFGLMLRREMLVGDCCNYLDLILANLRRALEGNRFTLNQKDEDERTALHWAAATGHPNIVDYLCGLGADVNTTDEGLSP
jgi:ankyrin repeat protein